jgi:signal transduction histidine kinase
MKGRPGLRLKHAWHSLGARLPRRTVRVRLAALLFAVFLVSGAALLAVTFAIWEGKTGNSALHAVPVRHGSDASGVTQVGFDQRQLLIASGIALAILAGVTFVLAWLLAGRLLRPLRTITATTREISAANLHERLDLTGPDDELTDLADTFNQLLDRLDRSFAFERQFVANASHELRTPLAGLRTSLDVAMAKPEPVPPHIRTLADRLHRELNHIDRLLESFLALAQTQQGPHGDESTVSLAELAGAAIKHRSDAISAKGLDVEQQPRPDAWVAGSETLLARMVENVIENAVGHNQPGGWIHVSTRTKDGRAHLVIKNGGPILDSTQVEQLTQPFRRIGAERTGSDIGSGLGLAIVSSIVQVHGGALQLEALADGGLRVAINLPLVVTTAAGTPT